MKFSGRISQLRPEGAYAVLGKAQALEAQGREIIHLEIGQPDFETFPNIVVEGVRAVVNGHTRYNPPAGIPELREALAYYAGRQRGLSFTAEQVVVAPGNKPFLLLPMLALLEPGDEVMYPDPGFPSYAAAISIAGARSVPVPLLEKKGFDLDLDAFEARFSPRVRMIILNSPSNPTGGILSLETLTHLARAARRYDCWILADEIYSRLVYEDQPDSIVSLPGMSERSILTDGFSKTYGMTGWRLGFAIVPRVLASRLELLLTHTVGCTATFTQHAGIEALCGPQEHVEAACQEFRRRRDLVVDSLNAVSGVRCSVPKGAFYAFPSIEGLGQESQRVADYLLTEAGVAVLPGTAFGPSGEGHLRLSYANSYENLERAMSRIGEALSALR